MPVTFVATNVLQDHINIHSGENHMCVKFVVTHTPIDRNTLDTTHDVSSVENFLKQEFLLNLTIRRNAENCFLSEKRGRDNHIKGYS